MNIDDYESEDEYQALSSWLSGRLDNWRNHRDNNHLKLWDEYYRLWRGQWTSEDQTRQSEKSKIITPALQQAVESSVAELEEATFGRGKWFDIKDDELDEDKSDVEYVRKILQEDLEATGAKDAICEVFLNGAIYGTGIAKIITEENVARRPVERPVEGTLTTARQIEDYLSVDVRLEAVSPKEFIIDPSANSINEALGVAHEVYKPRYIVSEGMANGIYRELEISANTDAVQIGYNPEYIQNDASDQIKLCEYWGKVPRKFLNAKESEDDFEYDEDELVEAVVTLANDEHVLRAEENPFMMMDRPFVSYQHDIVPNKFWGRGVCEKGYNPQKALDAEMRARIDSLALTTTPMIAADATRLPRGIKLEVRPGKTILTNGDPRAALMPLTLGSTDQNTYSQVASLQNMIQMGTGSADMGAPDRATSSGMSMVQSASIKRQKRTLMNFQNTFLIPMVNKSMWRKIQFDVERYPVTDYKFVPYSTMGIMAKELEMQQMVQMLQSIPKDSPAFNVLLLAVFQNSSIHNRDQVVQSLMQGFEPNPEEQQMQQQHMQLEMQQLQADIQKTLAEAQEEQARAMKHQADANASQPQNELDLQERLMGLQKKMIELEKMKADIEKQHSETARNIPEVEHLKSETALNYANALRRTND
tara:strand:- start:143 stop:2086 length:1944 start_codon:yes stop_codon:yes gene_type:complete